MSKYSDYKNLSQVQERKYEDKFHFPDNMVKRRTREDSFSTQYVKAFAFISIFVNNLTHVQYNAPALTTHTITHTYMHSYTNRQLARQTYIWMNGLTDMQTDTRIRIHADRQTKRLTEVTYTQH